MHELSIAMSIVDLAIEEARKEKSKKITEIEIEVGTWAGVDSEALLFSLNATKQYSDVLKDSEIRLIKREPLMYCSGCNREFTPKVQYTDTCAYCNSAQIELIQGRELALSSLSIQE